MALESNMDRKDQADAHWFSADRPISDAVQDQLGRDSFARALGQAIRGWTGQDSLVIGLYGPWGSGKTSVKNLTVAALKETKGKGPLLVDFNPWRFSSREQLTEAFFDQIGIQLGKGTLGSNKQHERVLRKWRLYAAYVKHGAALLDITYKPLSVLLALAGLFLIGGGILTLPSWLKISSGVLLILVSVLIWSSKVMGRILRLIEARTLHGRQTLEESKASLASDLNDLQTPLLVILDDVDRLPPDEVLQVFQLVKANADFPNLVYLLLFERAVVEQHIEERLRINSREYLGKIIQVGFDIPAIEKTRLQRVLLEGLDKLLNDEPLTRRFDRQRWGNLFVGALQYYFLTLRHVNRFLSTFAFHVSVFRASGSFEVNPVDLIGLEVLRVFEPDVYRGLADNKELLTSMDSLRHQNDQLEKEARQQMSELIARAPEDRRGQVKEIVQRLFPPAEWTLGGSRYADGYTDTWFRELRVCSEDVFDRYFTLAIPQGDISQASIDRVLATANDRAALRAEFKKLAAQKLLGVALDRLEAYKQQIPIEHAYSFVTALFDLDDELPRERPGMLGISPTMHGVRIVVWYLRQEKDPGRRADILQYAISTTDGLILPVEFVSLEDEAAQRKSSDYERVVDDPALQVLKGICVERIRQAAQAGQLAANRDLPSLLYRWEAWAGSTEPKDYCEGLAKTQQGALVVVSAFLQKSISHGLSDHVAREHWYITLGGIEHFVPWEKVEKQLDGINQEHLSPDEKRAVDAFARATIRRRAGKPDFGRGINFGEEN